MKGVPESLNNLITQFSGLPGIGKKTAERLALFVLKSSTSKVNEFSNAFLDVKKNISIDDVSCCFKENNLTVNDLMDRDDNILCIIGSVILLIGLPDICGCIFVTWYPATIASWRILLGVYAAKCVRSPN